MELNKQGCETIFRLDTHLLQNGWQQVHIATPLAMQGCQYGVLPLSDTVDFRYNSHSSLIVFGGLDQ